MPPLRRTFAVANFNDQKEYPPPAPERFEQRQRMHQPPLSLPAVAADSPSGVFAAVFMSLAVTAHVPRRSSPLGPRRHELPARPVFPPSVRKPNLYRLALKRATRVSTIRSQTGPPPPSA